MEKISLTVIQNDNKNKIINLYKSVKENKLYNNIALFEGYAGTGKTTLIKYLLEELVELKANIAIASFTNVAADTVKKIINPLDEIIKCSTIHSLFGLEPDIELFKYNENKEVKESYLDTHSSLIFTSKEDKIKMSVDCLDVLIIDEFSVIDDELLKLVLSVFNYNKSLLIVFVGDREQNKPIKHILSEPLPVIKFINENLAKNKENKGFKDYDSSTLYNISQLEQMKEVVRCKNIKLKYYYEFFISRFNDQNFIKTMNKEKSFPFSEKSELISIYDIKKIFEKGNTVIIPFSNNSRNYYNKLIKGLDNIDNDKFVSEFYFDNDDIVTLDNNVNIHEYSISDGIIEVNFDVLKDGLRKGIDYIVKDIVKGETLMPNIFECIGINTIESYLVKLSPVNDDTNVKQILCISFAKRKEISDNLSKNYGKISRHDGKKINKIIGSLFGGLYHAYSITLYKSQSRTYKKVIIDVRDIINCTYSRHMSIYSTEVKNKELLSRLYTSLTRTSDNVYYLST
jgi:hypothetical protein